MKIRASKLWRIPALSFGTGILLAAASKFLILLMQNWAFSGTLIVYDVLLTLLDLALTILAGVFFMKGMTQREAVFSAGIVTGLHALMLVAQQMLLGSGLTRAGMVVSQYVFGGILLGNVQPAILIAQLSGAVMVPMFCFAFWPFLLALFAREKTPGFAR
ncbi:hypothetical protein [Zongyangia hominis]|uniref:Uncharacterized protein n=1 Tax=Zongyangia hominis TaxID=2763677 RepID=A0A926E9T3_9FIRM|nr:hypothetical protein [Zongyangia hominis]MBC8569833.1 hypothetical protein [Zongyangia hominis]